MDSNLVSESYYYENFVLQFRNATPEANSVIFLIFNSNGILDKMRHVIAVS